MTDYFYASITILLTVYGQMIIKSRTANYAPLHEGAQFLTKMLLDPLVLSGLIAAFAASATWMMAIRTAPLSLMYPVMALTFIIVPVLSSLIFGERLTVVQFFGLAFIVIGVALAVRTP